MMEWHSVDSSFISRIGYDEGKLLLHVDMVRGKYQYTEVPKNIFDTFLASSSAGKYWNLNIKGGYGEEAR